MLPELARTMADGRQLLARQNHVPHDRIDLLLPTPAGEDTVVADTRLPVVTVHVGFDALAQLMGRRRLAQGADVVAFALDP